MKGAYLAVADPGRAQRVRSNPIPDTYPVFKYPLKMKYFGLNETKLFHFYGIFKKKRNKISKVNPNPFLHMNPFPEILDPSLFGLKVHVHVNVECFRVDRVFAL